MFQRTDIKLDVGQLPVKALQLHSEVAAPAGTLKAIVDRIYREIARVLATPEAQEWFKAAGAEPQAITPEAFSAIIRADYVKWGKIINDAGIRVE